MALVQALSRDFTRMINPHQTCGMGLLLVREACLGDIGGRVFTSWPTGWHGDGSERIVGSNEEAVERRQISFSHGQDYSNSVISRTDGILRARLKNGARKMNWRSLLTLGLLALAMPLLAQEDEETEEDSPWSGSVTLGYLATTGNTEGSSLNSGAEINYTLEFWEHQATAAAVFTTEDKTTTAEAYDAGWKSARNLTEHNYLYGRLDWRKDRFGSILEQFSQTIGYGRRLIEKEKHQLNGELGFGARQSDLSDNTNENDAIYTGRLTYTWQISETASFGQSLLVESGDSNTFTESVTNLRAKLIGSLALVASYTVRHNSDVVQDDFNTDTRSALSLEYGF